MSLSRKGASGGSPLVTSDGRSRARSSADTASRRRTHSAEPTGSVDGPDCAVNQIQRMGARYLPARTRAQRVGLEPDSGRQTWGFLEALER